MRWIALLICFVFFDCRKASSPPNKPVTASLQFSFKGYPVKVIVLKIDTLIYGGYGEKSPLITGNIKYADMTLISFINGVEYRAPGNGTQDFYLTITSNAVDTLKASFAGILLGNVGNSDSLSTAAVTDGVFQLNY